MSRSETLLLDEALDIRWPMAAVSPSNKLGWVGGPVALFSRWWRRMRPATAHIEFSLPRQHAAAAAAAAAAEIRRRCIWKHVTIRYEMLF